MNLSTHFTLEEATLSSNAERAGITNNPDSATLAIMLSAATKLEKVRVLLAAPMHIDSWYRSPEVNKLAKSKPTSQHIKGEAIDFICPHFGSPLDICKRIIANKDLVNFDQLILEHSWVHISFSILERQPRGQVLSLLASGDYAIGLTDLQGKQL
jgi:hypothetical protein